MGGSLVESSSPCSGQCVSFAGVGGKAPGQAAKRRRCIVLTPAVIEQILDRIPRSTIGVIGDLFLDRYLDIDAALTEPSVETGLDAYQVVRVRSYPGAAGTVINNLAALGVGQVCPIAVIGEDGEGYELRQALQRLGVVDPDKIFAAPERRTPTYTKPMLHSPNQPARELNRLDIKNRTRLAGAEEERVLQALDEVGPQMDALIISDQVSKAECGVITTRVRERLAELGQANPEKLILADRRNRIGLFRPVPLKPNQAEGVRAIQGDYRGPEATESCVRELARRAGRPVFCTRCEQGILLFDPCRTDGQLVAVPAYPVSGPIDVVGAGDSVSAGIACAVAAGATLEQAAAFGN